MHLPKAFRHIINKALSTMFVFLGNIDGTLKFMELINLQIHLNLKQINLRKWDCNGSLSLQC